MIRGGLMPRGKGTGQTPEFDLIWMQPERGRPDGRPPLSRGQIVRAAVELADEQGLSAVSMRRIADGSDRAPRPCTGMSAARPISTS